MYTIHLEFLLIASKLKLSYQDLNLASPAKTSGEARHYPNPSMPSASPRPRFARFPFIRLKALAPLEQAVRLKHCVRGCSPRIIQIMSNKTTC